MNPEAEEFYKRLKEQLETTSTWPSVYLFKFIVPNEEAKILSVENAFNNMGAIIQTKTSSKGNYTSVSINVPMDNPDQVIEKYVEVSLIEGIISL